MRLLSFGLGVFVYILDLLTKHWVEETTALHFFPVVQGFVTLQYVRNEGIAFGLFHSVDSQWKPVFLSIIALVALAVVCYYILRSPLEHRLQFVSFGLLLGGILGNFVDRARNGYVVDFVTLHWKDHFAWPTFNLADSAITVGVLLLLVESFLPVRRTKLLFLLALLPFMGGQIRAQGIDEIVLNLQRKYEELQSFSAEFEQVFESRGVSLRERGVVMMKKPGRMYWEYRDPVRKFFVADGTRSYFYVPADKQVLVHEFEVDSADSPLLFLLGRGQIARDFVVEEVGAQETEAGMPRLSPVDLTLKLTPRLPHPEYSYVLLGVNTVTLRILSLSVIEPIGQRNDYLLTKVQENVKIPDEKFRLKLPPGTEVIEQ